MIREVILLVVIFIPKSAAAIFCKVRGDKKESKKKER
jgi:hypothetical protein